MCFQRRKPQKNMMTRMETHLHTYALPVYYFLHVSVKHNSIVFRHIATGDQGVHQSFGSISVDSTTHNIAVIILPLHFLFLRSLHVSVGIPLQGLHSRWSRTNTNSKFSLFYEYIHQPILGTHPSAHSRNLHINPFCELTHQPILCTHTSQLVIHSLAQRRISDTLFKLGWL